MTDIGIPTSPPVDEHKVLEEILVKLRADPVLAHSVVFKHRHPQATPPFHRQMILDFWSTEEYVGEMAFRGAGKSTLAEEALTLMALFGVIRYGVIIGESYDRACERLSAIKHELDTNDIVQQIWGDVRGETWGAGEIILKNGVKLQAAGAGQSLRGMKHRDARPDMLFIDDLESKDSVATEEQRDKTMKYVTRDLIPACEPISRKRIAGTPLHPKAWLERMRKESRWLFRVHPIVTPAVSDPNQWEKSNWPERFPLDFVRNLRDDAERIGELQGFVQEYLCQSEEAALKPFQQRHIVPAPTIPSWAPAMLICDPARTVDPTKSARSGYMAISWVGAKLYVRYAQGAYDMPASIINELFRLDEVFNPIYIGVEKDGLEQFLMQPLRAEMLNRGRVLPIKPLNAPREKSKIDFIKGLHPFFEAGDILMCGDMSELTQEILNFPTGLVDVLNCLAYSIKMRGGKPVYPDFGLNHIAQELTPTRHSPAWLVINAEVLGGAHVAAALVQFVNGAFRVFGDWVREGTPDEAIERILPEAIQITNGANLKIAASSDQFDTFNNYGLGRALQRLGVKRDHIQTTPAPDKCLGALTPLLRSQANTVPAFLVHKDARWTANALSLGYAFGLDKTAVLNPLPDPGYYTTLMRGLESFARWLTASVQAPAGAAGVNWAYTNDGRAYISSRGGQANGPRELKIPS